jgi:enamine deaminase RidA (YjgF/YER057c/UK114 family)
MSGFQMSAEDRVKELGLEVPAEPFKPAGQYVNAARSGNLLFVGGQVPAKPDGSIVRGKLGDDMDVNAGYEAARLSALNALATLRAELGSLDRVVRVLRVYGVVNSTPDFMLHTRVIDGASDLLVEVFGDAGRHTRLAVGVASLPAGMALEFEMVVEVAD